MSVGKWLTLFWRILLPPSSGSVSTKLLDLLYLCQHCSESLKSVILLLELVFIAGPYKCMCSIVLQ